MTWTNRERLTGITLGLLDKRSREVTWRVWSSVHRTSSVNSTEHSGQKSSQVQSCRTINNSIYISLPAAVSLGHLTADWYYDSILTLEYCILSTMSSLVRGMRPDKKGNVAHQPSQEPLCSYCDYTSNYCHQAALKASPEHWNIPTLCAMNSSCSTDELASIWIQSIAANKVIQVQVSHLLRCYRQI